MKPEQYFTLPKLYPYYMAMWRRLWVTHATLGLYVAEAYCTTLANVVAPEGAERARRD